MGRHSKIYDIEALYRAELLHTSTYRALARTERDPKLRSILERLSGLERTHARLWGKLLGINDAARPRYPIRLETAAITLLRRLLGHAITVKAIEYTEQNKHR